MTAPSLAPSAELEVLTIDVDLGARHTLQRPWSERGPFGGYVDVRFTFPEDVPEDEQRRQARDLQAVLDQASPEVLRRDAYTEPEMRLGLAAARQYYLDHGRLSAELVLGEPEITPRRTLSNLWRTGAGLEPKKLAGRRVRIRGWVEERGGPWVDAARPEQIEVVNN